MFTKIWNQTRVIKEKITEAATGENSQWDLDAKAWEVKNAGKHSADGTRAKSHPS